MKKHIIKSTVFTVTCMLVFSAGSAFAGTATNPMTVQATVTANCTINTAGLNFGNYDPVVVNATTALQATAQINVVCTNGSAANITLDQGLNPAAGSSAAAPLRQMISGATPLSYSLFQDAADTTTWGNTAATGENLTGSGVSQAFTVFGVVPAGQNVPAGAYTDTVTMTISF